MFKQYQSIIQKASKKENSIISEFAEKKQSNTLEIKNVLETEANKITKEQILEDYNPLEFYNEIAELNLKHKNINIEEQKLLDELKISTNKDLLELMNMEYSNPSVTKISKIINKCNTEGGCPYYICRVWFTLIPLNSEDFQSNPGDPIKIEWILINGKPRSNDNTDSIRHFIPLNKFSHGVIPNFVSKGCVCDAPNFIGKQDNMYEEKFKLWKEWVDENRPIK